MVLRGAKNVPLERRGVFARAAGAWKVWQSCAVLGYFRVCITAFACGARRERSRILYVDRSRRLARGVSARHSAARGAARGGGGVA